MIANTISVFKWDSADEVACRDGVAQIEERLGPVSILVNNAGITRDGVFHTMRWGNWRAVLAANLGSIFAMGCTKALTQENAARGITVNAVCCGCIDTDMVAAVREEVRAGIVAGIPAGPLGDPDEIAQAVSYLASPKAAFCTGSVLTINGGQYVANG